MGRDAVHGHPVQPGGAANGAGSERTPVTPRWLGGALAVLAALGTLTPVSAHDPITTRLTYSREIRAILHARCESCHAPGSPGPMPLTTYDEVRPWARAIKDQVLSRRMPKWSAARGYGAFANDPSLTPNEMAIVAAWVNGGQPQGLATAAASTAPPATVKPQTAAVIVPASAADVSVEVAAGWVSGWLFQPGDPLVTTATVTSGDGAPLGTWVAGDGPVQLPAGSGLRLISPIRVQLKRRTAADYEKAVTPAASRLHLTTRATTPVRRVWLERLACGEPRTRAAAQLLAVRPLLADHSSARVWLERAGAPHVIIGWFRDAEALYPRTYWLARPIGLTPESRIAADASCEMELTLASR